LEEYWTGGGGELSPERVFDEAARCERVLRARGVPGLILPTLFNDEFTQWSWAEIAIACIGEHLFTQNGKRRPESRAAIERFHLIQTDYFDNMRLACESLRTAGYRRIGFMVSDWHDEHAHRRYTGAFLAEQRQWPTRDRLPVLRDEPEPGSDDAHLRVWIQRWKPDAIVCCKNDTVGRIEKAGLRVPDDVGVAHLWWAPDVEDWSGIDPRMESIGAAAVDVLVQQLRSNERGAPLQPVSTTFRGQWHMGRTTRSVYQR
jgi:DNA-binding LacI/PurR family transcriptional regulator